MTRLLTSILLALAAAGAVHAQAWPARPVTVGFEIVANTPEQFAAYQQRESARWKQLIEARRITAD